MTASFEEILGYTFREKKLLETALTHSSYSNELKNKTVSCNERLEFLGDSLLGAVVAHHLYTTHPDLSEGKMTRLRSDMVCERSLAAVASRLNIGENLRLGKGEEQGGGRNRPSILADAVEAVLAAVFLDGGIDAVRAVIAGQILDFESQIAGALADYKTELQELVQKRKNPPALTYVTTGSEGLDHEKTFTVEVKLGGKTVGEGTGRTKKAAEQSAAKCALEGIS